MYLQMLDIYIEKIGNIEKNLDIIDIFENITILSNPDHHTIIPTLSVFCQHIHVYLPLTIINVVISAKDTRHKCAHQNV